MATYVGNYSEVGKFLRSEQARILLRYHAEVVATRVRANLAGHVDTGETLASVHVEDGPVVRNRVSARVAASGAIVQLEFGNRRTRRVAPLRRALSFR